MSLIYLIYVAVAVVIGAGLFALVLFFMKRTMAAGKAALVSLLVAVITTYAAGTDFFVESLCAEQQGQFNSATGACVHDTSYGG